MLIKRIVKTKRNKVFLGQRRQVYNGHRVVKFSTAILTVYQYSFGKKFWPKKCLGIEKPLLKKVKYNICAKRSEIIYVRK